MMILTDTHTHLYYETDAEKLAALMQRSFENQVTRLFLPNVNLRSMPLMFQLHSQYPQHCFPMIGLHPCEVKKTGDPNHTNYIEELATLKKHLTEHKVYAIGEIGIDLHWDKSTLDIQRKAFILQINWAKELDLPIVIHCRDAFDEVFQILADEVPPSSSLRVIFHCFTGNLDQAKKIIDLHFYLGIGGVLTYKNSDLSQVIRDINLEYIVLETDAPYLTPVPHRGKPNESSFLIHIAQELANIKQQSLEEIARITTANATKIFGI